MASRTVGRCWHFADILRTSCGQSTVDSEGSYDDARGKHSLAGAGAVPLPDEPDPPAIPAPLDGRERLRPSLSRCTRPSTAAPGGGSPRCDTGPSRELQRPVRTNGMPWAVDQSSQYCSSPRPNAYERTVPSSLNWPVSMIPKACNSVEAT